MAVALFDHTMVQIWADGGVCRIVAICEDTQTETMPDGSTSPLVVRIRLENTTTRAARGTWVHSNGSTIAAAILPGENAETNIAPNRRVALYRLPHSLALGAS